MEIGRKIYYDKETGNIIQDTGERSGDVVETTVDQDFEVYVSLAQRVRATVGVLELEFGEYIKDFMECNGYRVNVETEELEFTYPDPDADPETPPVYQQPLTTQVSALTAGLTSTQLALADNYEQTLTAQEDATNAQLALADLYELTLSLQAEVATLKGGAS